MGGLMSHEPGAMRTLAGEGTRFDATGNTITPRDRRNQNSLKTTRRGIGFEW